MSRQLPNPERIEQLQAEWTNRYVAAQPNRPELTRFVGRVGRVVTVNHSGQAIVDFGDGGWYDIPADADWLITVIAPHEISRYNASRTSAQARPDRQG